MQVTGLKNKARLYGVGVGPGDPMLLTLKADETIFMADVIAYISNAQGYSLAKDIARNSIAKKAAGSFQEVSIPLTMDTERTTINKMYDQAAREISQFLEQGKNVVFLCEGDPLFYGSFAYLIDRLGSRYNIDIVPGICSIHAAAAASQIPLGLLKEKIAIFSGRHSRNEIFDALQNFENIVILKAGRSRAEIVQLIADADRIQDACYIEYATQSQQKVVKDISQLSTDAGPYFSLFLVNASRAYQ